MKIEINVTPKDAEKWLIIVTKNKSNPNSCEREPTKRELKLPVSKFSDKYSWGIADSEDEICNSVSKSYLQAIGRGYNYFVISKYEFDYVVEKQQKYEEERKILNLTASLNQKGKELEKEGKIEEAIAVYEENIKLEYPATHSYERLMVLYRKQKDKENAIRVIKLAIRVFLKANQQRVENCIKKHPERSKEIYSALTTCSNIMGDNGFYILVLYDVIKYRNQLNKLITK